MDYIPNEKGKTVTLSPDEILKTFEMLYIDVTVKNPDGESEWFLDRKPLKIKIQTNTLCNI